MLGRFHAFGHHLQPQVFGHRNDEPGDGGIPCLPRGIAHKTTVDFQLVQGQALQVGQAGIAGAEVINRKAHAQTGQLVHAGHHHLGLLDQQALGHFQHQTARVGTAGGQDGLHIVHKPVLTKLAHAHIDRQVQLEPRLLQLGQCAAPLAQCPQPHGHDESVVFGQGHEFCGRHHAACGVLPANQQLGPGQAAIGPQLRLGKHLELALGQRSLQIALLVQAQLHLRLHGGRKKGQAAAPTLFGAVHGNFGFLDQVFRSA